MLSNRYLTWRLTHYRKFALLLVSSFIISAVGEVLKIGSKHFKLEMEWLTGRRVHNIKRGRPIGGCKENC